MPSRDVHSDKGLEAHVVTKFPLAVLLLSIAASEAAFAQASFIPLGNLPGSTGGSAARAISADGRVAVGIVVVEDAGSPGGMVGRAFRWTAAGGMVDLGDLAGGGGSEALAVNADGSVVAGVAAGYDTAFRWSQSTGMVELQHGAGEVSTPSAVSTDGRYVSGSLAAGLVQRAVRWDETGSFQSLGPEGTRLAARGMSADGSRVVGYKVSDPGRTAFTWTAAGGYSDLPNLPGDTFRFSITPNAMSGDGTAFVGEGDNDLAGRTQAFRWTEASGYQYLALNPAASSVATALDFDGSVVVGNYFPGGLSRAFYWTESGGGVDLQTLLAANGATGLAGWTLVSATGVSADGTVVVGTARNAALQDTAFIAVIPAPGPVGALLLGLLCIRRRRAGRAGSAPLPV